MDIVGEEHAALYNSLPQQKREAMRTAIDGATQIEALISGEAGGNKEVTPDIEFDNWMTIPRRRDQKGLGVIPELIEKLINNEYDTAYCLAAAGICTFEPDSVTPSFAKALATKHNKPEPAYADVEVPNGVTPKEDTAYLTAITGSPDGKHFGLQFLLLVVGWAYRGSISQANQKHDNHWLTVLKNISNYTGAFPAVDLPVKENPKTTYTPQVLCAVIYIKKAWNILSETGLRYTILRPACGGYMTLYRRASELQAKMPGVLKDFEFLMGDAQRGGVLVLKKLAAVATAIKNPVIMWAARGISPDYLSFLSSAEAKRGAAALFYSLCVLKDDMKAWEDFSQNENNKGLISNEERSWIAGYFAYKSKVSASEQYRGVSFTPVTLPTTANESAIKTNLSGGFKLPNLGAIKK